MIGGDTLREDLARWWAGVRGKRDALHGVGEPDNDDRVGGEFWALREVNFEARQGEILGIIGRNGAGKSTLLKILSRITEPTAGRVRIRGRVASLLEVGTGFHPELTGRENIFLNGAILGMTNVEIKSKFDEIVAFAEIEKFLDTPVKRYSSGMYVRLAFAVAAHLDPEILIVDEVLAVGDAQFQKKCLGKMDSKAKEGRTVLFVSHQMTAVSGLCSRAILLNQGGVVKDGATAEVVDLYMRGTDAPVDIVGRPRRFESVGNDKIQLLSMMVGKRADHNQPYVMTSDDLEIALEFENRMPNQDIDVTLDLFNEYGVHVCHFGTICAPDGRLADGVHRCTGIFPGHILNMGRYTLHIQFGLSQRHVLFRYENAINFTLEDDITIRGSNFSRLPGVIHPRTEWVTQRILKRII